MRHKTYLSSEDQWDRSVALVLEHWQRNRTEPRLDDFRTALGVIAVPHRLLCPGDIVFVVCNNGAAKRYPVWAVSSKGYEIRGLYLTFQRWRGDKRRPGGPLRLVDLPGDLVGKRPDHPVVRRFAVETLVRRRNPARREGPHAG